MLRFRAVCCLRWAPALQVQHWVLCRLGARCSTRALSTACLLLIYMHQAVRHAATSAQRAGHG
eukprot:scaffold20076_cov145-Isochrysis_galbana.AAC.2